MEFTRSPAGMIALSLSSQEEAQTCRYTVWLRKRGQMYTHTRTQTGTQEYRHKCMHTAQIQLSVYPVFVLQLTSQSDVPQTFPIQDVQYSVLIYTQFLLWKVLVKIVFCVAQTKKTDSNFKPVRLHLNKTRQVYYAKQLEYSYSEATKRLRQP